MKMRFELDDLYSVRITMKLCTILNQNIMEIDRILYAEIKKIS